MSNIATLKPITKGDPRGGRVPGQVNRITRALKTALILAAEESRHSKDKSLKSYCTFLADERPELFAGLLGKLIPVQARVKTEGLTRVDLERLKLDMSMSLPEMISAFEAKIKSDYVAPPRALIDHDDHDDDDDDEPDA